MELRGVGVVIHMDIGVVDMDGVAERLPADYIATELIKRYAPNDRSISRQFLAEDLSCTKYSGGLLPLAKQLDDAGVKWTIVLHGTKKKLLYSTLELGLPFTYRPECRKGSIQMGRTTTDDPKTIRSLLQAHKWVAWTDDVTDKDYRAPYGTPHPYWKVFPQADQDMFLEAELYPGERTQFSKHQGRGILVDRLHAYTDESYLPDLVISALKP